MTKQTLSSQLIAKIANIDLDTNYGFATGISFHSNRVKKGDAFFALAGENSHGIRFAEHALELGAKFIVSDIEHEQGILVPDPAKLLMDLGHWARAQHNGNIIAVTGSVGKTSAKSFIASALDIPKSPGNFNTPLALAKTLIETVINTENNQDLVLELGIDRLGEMDILLALARPDYAVLTLISESHLSGLGSLENIATEKKKILNGPKISFVSTDVEKFVNKTSNIKTYGLFPGKADYVSKLIAEDINGQTLEFDHLEYKIPVLSSVMAKAATVALALAKELNYDLIKASQRLAKIRLEPNRLEIRRHSNFLILDDSYNSSPAAIKETIKVLKKLPKPHMAILGDMLELGPNSAKYHQDLSKYMTDLKLITIGNDAQFISKGNSKAVHFNTIEDARAYLRKLKKEGSILVKASRGMKFENILDILEAEQ